jgi:hypothetical protein
MVLSLCDIDKNHYQAMLDDTNNIYFYRIRSRDAAGRLTGHIVGNGLSTEQDYSLYNCNHRHQICW